MAKEPYLPCGKVTSTHGVRGTVRIESWCDTPETLARLKILYEKKKDGSLVPHRVKASSIQKGTVLCTMEDFSTLEAAIPLKGATLYADRRDIKLRPGANFIADLLGLPVLDAETGERYGILKEVDAPAGQELYTVEEADGGTFFIPAVPAFIKRTVTEGPEAGIYVVLIEGMRGA